jgi:hypothetical protein
MTSYSYRAVLTGIGNCVIINTDPVILTVTPKAVTVVATDKSKVYGDKPHSYCNGNRCCADVINYTLATTAVTEPSLT